MYEIQFFKANDGIGRIYVRNTDLDCAKLCIENHGHTIIRIDNLQTLEWLFYAYIREPRKRFKRWWA